MLAKTDYGSIGGAEVQQVFIAKELKKNGFNISFLVGDYGTKSIEYIDGIRVVKSFSKYKRGKSKYVPAICALFSSLCKTAADVYFVRNPRHLLGVVGIYCQLKKKKLVFSSSIDYDSDLQYIKSAQSCVSTMFYLCGLRQADAIIVQSVHQQKQFREGFGYETEIIKNLQPLSTSVIEKTTPSYVLWVGTAYERKKPELFLELAKALPSITFRMIIGPGGNNAFHKTVHEQAGSVANLEYLGFVPYHKIDGYYARASVLVCTSCWEGFPNTFLQAWAHETPVVSLTIDPDEIICKNGMGFHSKSFEQMVQDVKRLIKNSNLRKKMGINARRYVEKEHNINKIGKQYADVMNRL